MKIIERLQMELNNKEYMSMLQYKTLLEENNLVAEDNYIKSEHQIQLLETVKDVLNVLSNNIELMMKQETEFITTSEAYRNLDIRISKLENRIADLKFQEESSSHIRPLFFR